MSQTTRKTTRTWSVDVLIVERDGRTHAEARLLGRDSGHLGGTGTARLNPRDSDVPEIGDELAAARALSSLAHELLLAASQDIEGATHERTRLDA